MNARGGEEEAAAAARPASRYTLLNDVVVDWERGCVLRDGQVTALEPKAAAFLARLCASSGATLTREQAIRTVWNGTHVVDEAVMRIVSLLRAALGDEARAPTFIETVPKRGYRLMAKTGELSGPVP
ncbi:MAG TPA: winged helix-turn-helix domain-containing protein, partial [Allosphingosinicella sp.]|nr:winged helix-turn-helix domain-containing protein [Allosphingosinicella sp.]